MLQLYDIKSLFSVLTNSIHRMKYGQVMREKKLFSIVSKFNVFLNE